MKSNVERNRLAAEVKTLKEDLQKCMDIKRDRPRPRVSSPPSHSQFMSVSTDMLKFIEQGAPIRGIPLQSLADKSSTL